MPQSSYPIYPSPTTGSGTPYGMVPGPIGMPNPYADLAGAFPALTQANKLAGTDLLAELGGNITPGTRNALQLAAAQTGAGRGMPLAGLGQNELLGNIVGFSEGQVKQGMQDYNSLIPNISKTQTVDPGLQTEIAARNALFAAAPDPRQANNLAQQLFDRYLNNLRGPGGGSGVTGPQQGAGAFQGTFATDRLLNPGAAGPATPGQPGFAPPGPSYPWNQPPMELGIGNLGPNYVDWTTSQPPTFEGPSGGGFGGGAGGAPYNPLEDFAYNPFTAPAGGAASLLPDYTNPLGIGNVGGGGSNTTLGIGDQAWNDVLSMF